MNYFNNNGKIMKFEPQNFEIGKTYETAYLNTITIDSSKSATITIFDKWRTDNDLVRDKEIIVHPRVAELYYYIESRFKEANPPLVYTTQHDKEVSWGFYKRYQNINEGRDSFYPLPIWIHFTGKSPKRLNIDVPKKYKKFLINTLIPTKPENWKTFSQKDELTYLIISEIISEDTIEEIMNILLKIKF
jgi:hypothetical protein